MLKTTNDDDNNKTSKNTKNINNVKWNATIRKETENKDTQKFQVETKFLIPKFYQMIRESETFVLHKK